MPSDYIAPAGMPAGIRLSAGEHAAASLIRKLRVWDEVSREEEAVLRDMLLPPTIIEAHHDIVAEGSRRSSSTLLVDGFAARYKLVEDGGRQITAVHVPGDFVDLHSFLLHQMDHGVSALTACRVATLPHPSLASIVKHYPHLGRLLWLATLVDGSIKREWLVGMGRRTATARLAHLICGVASRLEVVGLAPKHQFLFPATQTDLGDMLGTSAVHMNRSLQELRARSLIQWKGHVVKILDWEGLTGFADFDPAYLHLRREPR